MKAIVQYKYGSPDDVLELQDIDKPVAKDDEVLVRVHATSVAGDDWHIMRGLPYVARIVTGLRRPKKNSIPGRDVAGHVEAVGKNVKQFQPGDEVFGWCNGAFAEYVSVSEDALALKPVNLTLEQAAAVPISAFTALQGLRDRGQIQPGHKVLINGASGGVGTFAVQIAKSFGAEVTGICSTRNVDMVRSIGADQVIDYTQEDFTRTDERHDLMLDVATSRSLSDCRRALTSQGTYVLIGGGSHSRWVGGLPRYFTTSALSPFVSQTMRAFFATRSQEDLVYMKNLLEAGKVTPIIDRTYPLSQTSQAISYVEEGHARGKVVITV